MTDDLDTRREWGIREGRRLVRRTPAVAARELPRLRQEVRQGIDPTDTWGPQSPAYVAGAEGKVVGISTELKEAVRCQVCGRELTDPLSVRRGIGPDCWAKPEVQGLIRSGDVVPLDAHAVVTTSQPEEASR